MPPGDQGCAKPRRGETVSSGAMRTRVVVVTVDDVLLKDGTEAAQQANLDKSAEPPLGDSQGSVNYE